MAFEDAFPLFHQGPRSDLTVAYVHADIGATGAVTMDAAKTSKGFAITRSDTGEYALAFPKCRFCLPIGAVRPADPTDPSDYRLLGVHPGIDATTGTVDFTTAEQEDVTADTSAVADPADGSEIVFLVLLGF